ncbi:MAG: GIY-YIG nuclease family protein [Desulfohalobiaceae bacterium]|nr:GIY-YIG nuclease family protein [Desulfohalobiaceae bacterium]
MENKYYVYILSNKSAILYIGITSDLKRRVSEHKQKIVPGFTKKYNIDRLVYYEETNDVQAAIRREKTIKGLKREKKFALIEKMNPEWFDLSKYFDF